MSEPDWQEGPGEWLGGYLHPSWAASWRRLVAALRWLGARISWPLAAFFPVGVLATIVVRALGRFSEPVEQALPVALSVVGAVGATAGILFGALRYNREEAWTVIRTQQAVLEDMRRDHEELLERMQRDA